MWTRPYFVESEEKKYWYSKVKPSGLHLNGYTISKIRRSLHSGRTSEICKS